MISSSKKEDDHCRMTAARRIRAFLELARPANVITAFADILAGFAAAGAITSLLFGQGNAPVEESCIPSACHCGAVCRRCGLQRCVRRRTWMQRSARNDPFQAAAPRGRKPPSSEVFFLWRGLRRRPVSAPPSFFIAVAVACCALGYDAAGKHHAVAGPIIMGLCRGGNLLLGASAVPGMPAALWFLALVPVAYVGAIVVISRGEVHGGSKRSCPVCHPRRRHRMCSTACPRLPSRLPLAGRAAFSSFLRLPGVSFLPARHR